MKRPTVRLDPPGSGGPDRPAAARVLGAWDNPLRWSFPIARVAGVELRAHPVLPIYMVLVLAFALPQGAAGLGYRAALVAALIPVLLIRETARVALARRLDRADPLTPEADHDVILWPLGNLARWPEPVPTTQSRLPAWSVHAAGLLAGALLALLLGAGVYAFTRDLSLLFPNPFQLNVAYAGLAHNDPRAAAALVGLWSLYVVNGVVLVANCLPMAPLDAGQALESAIHARRGRDAARRFAARVGLITALALAVAAVLTSAPSLLGLAAVGVLAAVTLAPLDAGLDAALARPEPAPHGPADPADPLADLDQSPGSDEGELDRILAKISHDGIKSLTRKERRALDEESRRRREN